MSLKLNDNIWFNHETKESGGMLDFIVYQGKAHDRSSAMKWLEKNNLKDPIKMTNVRKKVIRHHIYRDGNGIPPMQAVKHKDGSWKQISWKDDDRARALGLLATCNSGGAKSWLTSST
ncbi:hypothetical protein OAA72_07280 [Amylibacter sp.]|nr:hypothetical protein [Amylibacter sp.]